MSKQGKFVKVAGPVVHYALRVIDPKNPTGPWETVDDELVDADTSTESIEEIRGIYEDLLNHREILTEEDGVTFDNEIVIAEHKVTYFRVRKSTGKA